MRLKNLRNEMAAYKASFRLDRRFWYAVALDVLTILIIAAAFYILSDRIESMAEAVSDIQPFDVNNPYYSVSRIRDVAMVQHIHKTFFKYLSIVIALSVIVTLITRVFVYAVVTRARMTKRLFKKLPPFIIAWTATTAGVAYLLQAVLYQLFAGSFQRSVSVQLTLIITVTVLIPLLIYFAMTPPLLFARTLSWKATMKSMYDVLIVKVGRFIYPMIFTLLVLIGINILMRIITRLFGGVVFMVSFTAMLLLYLSWMRVYYNATLDRVLPKTVKKVKRGRKAKKKRTGKKKAKKAKKR